MDIFCLHFSFYNLQCFMKTERERHEHIYTLFGSLLDLYKEERGSFRDSVNSGAYKTI